ncbi:hypothetical protein KCTC32516_01762 [Polaribacter huanghezhanensis]|uniref:hypothetical protein n=1 Tax=Polaribacter huanghezhanensis TaxID=1354726 RepID=UPI002649769F|nr:hypothetical protein [Polaribacter huanghezhanensis]WKD86387.1 hypothetical protein KCTC32516_01762 [Polaribacter huanghezhanensis]
MKLKSYKVVGFLFTAFFISSLHAQKFDKKFNENFNVNKDVVLAINATNADINVTTWNRNEVAVEAVITVEGLSKKEAEKFLKSWEFEALGNKSKVQVNANANQFLPFGDNDFKFDFDFKDIVIPELNFDINIPEFKMPEIKIPEININFDEIFDNIDDELDNHDFDEEDTKTFSYKSNGKQKTIVIKTKKEWEKFKKSKDFEDMKADIKKGLKKAQEGIKKIDKKMIEETIKRAKIQYEKIDKEKLKANFEKAKANIEKMKIKMANQYKNGDNVITIENGKTKKNVKITRKITIRVPKNATFELNTRHSKVQLPKGKTSGKVSYGSFKSDEINGGDLKIYYAPVNVAILSASTLSLNNITDATIASVINTKLSSNSSGLTIKKLDNNVDLTSKFGELLILNVVSGLQNFKLDLSFSDATIDFNNLEGKLPVISTSKIINLSNKKNTTLSGSFNMKNKIIDIKGKQSELTIKKQ